MPIPLQLAELLCLKRRQKDLCSRNTSSQQVLLITTNESKRMGVLDSFQAQINKSTESLNSTSQRSRSTKKK